MISVKRKSKLQKQEGREEYQCPQQQVDSTPLFLDRKIDEVTAGLDPAYSKRLNSIPVQNTCTMNLDDIGVPDFTSLRISNLTFSFGEVAILLLVKHSKISSTFQLSDLYDIMQIIQVLFTPISCNKNSAISTSFSIIVSKFGY